MEEREKSHGDDTRRKKSEILRDGGVREEGKGRRTEGKLEGGEEGESGAVSLRVQSQRRQLFNIRDQDDTGHCVMSTTAKSHAGV